MYNILIEKYILDSMYNIIWFSKKIEESTAKPVIHVIIYHVCDCIIKVLTFKFPSSLHFTDHNFYYYTIAPIRTANACA